MNFCAFPLLFKVLLSILYLNDLAGTTKNKKNGNKRMHIAPNFEQKRDLSKWKKTTPPATHCLPGLSGFNVVSDLSAMLSLLNLLHVVIWCRFAWVGWWSMWLIQKLALYRPPLSGYHAHYLFCPPTKLLITHVISTSRKNAKLDEKCPPFLHAIQSWWCFNILTSILGNGQY